MTEQRHIPRVGTDAEITGVQLQPSAWKHVFKTEIRSSSEGETLVEFIKQHAVTKYSEL